MANHLKEHLYLWCHNPGVYNDIPGIPGQSFLTAREAAEEMGIENLIMVCYGGKPLPPFEPIQDEFKKYKNVIWSIVGDAACKYENNEAFVNEVISLQKKYPNIKGGVLDDFFLEGRTFDLETISRKMREANLPLWVVVYDFQLEREDVLRKLNDCDVITFWTWDVKNLASMEHNLRYLHAKYPEKKIVSGCYLWNFGSDLDLTVRHMEYQCNTALDCLKEGIITDIIFVGSPLIGMGLQTEKWTKEWIKREFRAL